VPSLAISCANPLQHASAIKELFVAHERPEFPEFFDRAYPSAVRGGGKSWIGMDETQRVVMHIGLFPQRFVLGDQTVIGGLLVNLMAARSYRTIFPALALLRRVVADSQAAGDVDFLYGDPNARAAGVLKAVGLEPVGELDRFAFPLASRHRLKDLAIRAYQRLMYMRSGDERLDAVAHAAAQFDVASLERPMGKTPSLRPFRPAELYRRRLAGYPSTTDHRFTFHWAGDEASPWAAALVRELPDGVAHLVSLTRAPSVQLGSVVPALATWLRRRGAERLWCSALVGTSLARELSRAGFVARHEPAPLVARALTDRGAAALRAVGSWEITDLDCDR
jgi:hypothetical protein